MKNTNTAKKETSQDAKSASNSKNVSTHIKLVKPRPSTSEVAKIQGPRDCFPLG